MVWPNYVSNVYCMLTLLTLLSWEGGLSYYICEGNGRECTVWLIFPVWTYETGLHAHINIIFKSVQINVIKYRHTSVFSFFIPYILCTVRGSGSLSQDAMCERLHIHTCKKRVSLNLTFDPVCVFHQSSWFTKSNVCSLKPTENEAIALYKAIWTKWADIRLARDLRLHTSVV